MEKRRKPRLHRRQKTPTVIPPHLQIRRVTAANQNPPNHRHRRRQILAVARPRLHLPANQKAALTRRRRKAINTRIARKRSGEDERKLQSKMKDSFN